MTRKRLLHIIKEKKPESISELARMLKRKESNVHNDLTFLEGIGLLELKEAVELYLVIIHHPQFSRRA